eukprot:TRINITY_DN9140_c0_g2_i1.p1 TRINITY_DN9140_c0_g2~~TRINITY_DN9140_c0_g2_i1.p1  ORF type:complete len:296 (+),score=47.90 TRINITY_DN9140_c0_g2_i1:60-890(+)
MPETRWAVNFNEWDPTEEQWSNLLKILPEVEAHRIGKFNRGRGITGRLNPDAKSSLIGRLLIHIQGKGKPASRTKEGKPYFTEQGENFNISHQGEYVTFASSEDVLVGCDVMKIEVQPSHYPTNDKTISEFFSSMQDCFSPSEWDIIVTPTTSLDQLTNFYVMWTLKESFVKAIGIGLGYELSRIEFKPSQWSSSGCLTATCAFDSSEMLGWAFTVQKLTPTHLVATAAGPFTAAIESYRNVLTEKPDPGPDALRHATEVVYRELTVPEVIEMLKD